MIKDWLKNKGKNLMFLTIGGYSISTEWGPKWASIRGLFSDIQSLISLFMGLGAVVAVTMIVISGYTLITSAGNPDKIEQGQKTLTGAIIGLIVVLAGGLIVKFVLQTMGVGN